MIFQILLSLSFAQDLPGEEIFTSVPAVTTTTLPREKVNPAPLVKDRRSPKLQSSNLPADYLKPLGRESTASELITPPKGSTEIFRGLKVGDILDVSVPHSVIAFPDEKAPVVSVADHGQLSGFKFIGDSYLEKNSKRIFINFSRLVIGQQIYDMKGVGVSSEGQPGLSGEYHSREAEYFTGDFIASFAAGYFDGLVPRKTNVFGQTETDSSVDSAVKKGLASGALSTADRFREKLKRAPEFSEIKGPFHLKILILDQAKTTK